VPRGLILAGAALIIIALAGLVWVIAGAMEWW